MTNLNDLSIFLKGEIIERAQAEIIARGENPYQRLKH